MIAIYLMKTMSKNSRQRMNSNEETGTSKDILTCERK